MKLPSTNELITAIRSLGDIQKEIAALTAEAPALKAKIAAHIQNGDIRDEKSMLQSITDEQRLRMIPHAIKRLEAKIPAVHNAIKEETVRLGEGIAEIGSLERASILGKIIPLIRPWAGEEASALAITFPSAQVLSNWKGIPLPEWPGIVLPDYEHTEQQIKHSIRRAEAMLDFHATVKERGRVQKGVWPLEAAAEPAADLGAAAAQ